MGDQIDKAAGSLSGLYSLTSKKGGVQQAGTVVNFVAAKAPGFNSLQQLGNGPGAPILSQKLVCFFNFCERDGIRFTIPHAPWPTTQVSGHDFSVSTR